MSQMAAVPDVVNEPDSLVRIAAETLYDKCVALARNLWWSWHPEVINLFRDLDPIRWRQLDHNPIALLAEFTPERLEMRAAELVLYSRINHAYRRLKEYMTETPTWGRTHAGVLGSQAGGLFLRRVRHPRIGADLFRRPGRALGRPHQKRQRAGRSAGGHRPVLRPGLFQAAPRHRTAISRKSISTPRSRTCRWSPPATPTASRSPSQIDTRTGQLLAKVWLMRVGRVNLYLLDCDVDGNSPEDRELTSRLYGGDHRTRIRQELVLGVGGVQALRGPGDHRRACTT